MGSPGSTADYEAGMSADVQFLKTVSAVEKRLQLIGRLPAVRIKAWLNKLKQSTSNLTWKRNRNLYARLLLEQLRAGCLEVPFNALPPEGPLPTLPTYLTYRFISPPRQRTSCCSGSEACSPVSHLRPHSAGLPAAAGHSSWAAMRASAPMPLLNQSSGGIDRAAAAAAGFLQPGQLSALSPIRCGQLPRQQGGTAGVVQHSWPDEAELVAGGVEGSKQLSGKRPSPGGVSAAGVSAGAAIAALAGGTGSPVRLRAGGVGSLGAVLRPGSPGAAGLLDAAVAIAAELEGGKVDAEMLDSRLRYAEDKILQQEAELVRLQGQAAAARRIVKAVTAATLGELVERYGSAATAWDSTTAQRPGSPSSRHPTYAESVSGPMWQLISSSIQEVLSSCDQQDVQWQHEQRGAAAAAAARFAADQQAQQEDFGQEQAAAAAKPGQESKPGGGSNATHGPAGNAALLEQQVVLKMKELVVHLQKRSGQLADLLQSRKEAATAAAAGSGVSAAEVAAAAVEAMRPMLKLIKHTALKDKVKLQEQLEAAADAAALAVDAAAPKKQSIRGRHSSSRSSSSECSSRASTDSSSSSSASSSSSGRDSSSEHGHGKNRRMQAQRQQQLQEQQIQSARIGRLQAGNQILLAIADATNKLSGQLQDGKKRLADAGSYSPSGSPIRIASAGVMAAHEHGLAAAAVAGITASLASAVSMYNMHMRELKQQLKALSKAAAAEASTDARRGSSKHSSQSKQQPALAASHSRGVSFKRSESFAATGLGSRAGDSTLAGTFGASSSSPSAKFSSVSHYLIGGAAAASSPASSPPPARASTALGRKSAFTSSLLSSQPAGTSVFSGSSTPAVTASAGAADAVHQNIASLSRQASRISERASVLLSGSTAAESGGVSSSLFARAASPSLGAANITSAGSLLGGGRGSLLSGARSSSFTAAGAGTGFGSSLLSSRSAAGTTGKLSGSTSLLGGTLLGVSGGSQQSSGSAGFRASSPSLLAAGGSLLGGGGSRSLAAMSSRLNTLSQQWGATGRNSSSFGL